MFVLRITDQKHQNAYNYNRKRYERVCILEDWVYNTSGDQDDPETSGIFPYCVEVEFHITATIENTALLPNRMTRISCGVAGD